MHRQVCELTALHLFKATAALTAERVIQLSIFSTPLLFYPTCFPIASQESGGSPF